MHNMDYRLSLVGRIQSKIRSAKGSSLTLFGSCGGKTKEIQNYLIAADTEPALQLASSSAGLPRNAQSK